MRGRRNSLPYFFIHDRVALDKAEKMGRHHLCLKSHITGLLRASRI
jgi:hypothetical protein